MQSIRSLIWIQIVAVATKTASMEKYPNYKKYVINIRFDKKGAVAKSPKNKLVIER